MNLILLSVVSLFFVLVSPAAVAKEPVRLLTGEYPPYLSAELAHGGVGVRVIREAFAAAGYDVVFEFLPWKRAYVEASLGKADATATWAASDKHRDKFHFSDPLYPSVGVFFYRKDVAFDWTSLDDLASYNLGATSSYTHTEAFRQAAESGALKVEFSSSDELNFRRLIFGRIDAFPINIEVGRHILTKNFPADQAALVTYHPREFSKHDVVVLFAKERPGSAALRDDFNQGLRQLKSTGAIKRYFDEMNAQNQSCCSDTDSGAD